LQNKGKGNESMAVINPYPNSWSKQGAVMSRMPGPNTTNANAPNVVGNQPMTLVVGAIIVLAILKFASEHPDTALRPAHIHIGGYNVITILLVWAVGFTLLKLLVTKWFPTSSAAVYVNWL
jgi:hypothetical protein